MSAARHLQFRRRVVPFTHRDGIPVPILGEHVMRLSNVIAPSTVAILSTALLVGLSGPALSQIDSTTQLPSVTVQAPKQVTRPQKPVATPYRPANRVTARRTSPAAQTPSPAPDSVLAKLARIERTSSNCTDGCQTSFKHGNQPWNGCSWSGGVHSPTCRNVNNFKTYSECAEHGLLLGWRSGEVFWYCSSLAAGQKFEVADRSGRR
jgi:hypothetical protein